AEGEGEAMGPQLLSEYPYLSAQDFGECVDRFIDTYRLALADRGTQVEVRAGRGHLGQQRCLVLLSPHHGIQQRRHTEEEGAALEDSGDIEDSDPAEMGMALDDDLPASCGTIEYHSVYSTTWRVPVLYVRVRGADGSIESMDVRQAGAMLAPDDVQLRGAMAAVEFGGALGVGDHPLTGEPFMVLHPCHTATLMRAVAPAGLDSCAYLAAWLSLTGPAVGLTLPSIMAEKAANHSVIQSTSLFT
ncbi:E2-like conjugating enzyme atg10, partial [Coemansia thaxteri]